MNKRLLRYVHEAPVKTSNKYLVKYLRLKNSIYRCQCHNVISLKPQGIYLLMQYILR